MRRRKHSSESGDTLRTLGFFVLSITNARGSENWSLRSLILGNTLRLGMFHSQTKLSALLECLLELACLPTCVPP